MSLSENRFPVFRDMLYNDRDWKEGRPMPLSVFAADIVLPAPLLLVEDDIVVRRRLEDILLQFGYKPDAIIFAATLAEARACINEQPVALALVDIGLPDGSGIDLIAELNALDPGVAILVISAWCTQDVILSALVRVPLATF